MYIFDEECVQKLRENIFTGFGVSGLDSHSVTLVALCKAAPLNLLS